MRRKVRQDFVRQLTFAWSIPRNTRYGPAGRTYDPPRRRHFHAARAAAPRIRHSTSCRASTCATFPAESPVWKCRPNEKPRFAAPIAPGHFRKQVKRGFLEMSPSVGSVRDRISLAHCAPDASTNFSKSKARHKEPGRRAGAAAHRRWRRTEHCSVLPFACQNGRPAMGARKRANLVPMFTVYVCPVVTPCAAATSAASRFLGPRGTSAATDAKSPTNCHFGSQ